MKVECARLRFSPTVTAGGRALERYFYRRAGRLLGTLLIADDLSDLFYSLRLHIMIACFRCLYYAFPERAHINIDTSCC